MTAPDHSQIDRRGSPSSVYWLKFDGHGNGREAEAWAPIVDIDERLAWRLLDVLATAGVAAYAAPLSVRATLSRSADRIERVWVDVVAYARAEDVVRVELPVITAWIQPSRIDQRR